MSLTSSTMLPIGTSAPDFSLPDAVSGQTVSLEDFSSAEALVVIFMCNHCPFVIHVHDELGRVFADYRDRGVAFVAINANDVEKYPDDAPDRMKSLVEEKGWKIPFLYDESQEIAHAYRAACTPDFYVFDGDRKLVYRGRLDASRPESDVPLTGEDVRAALDAVLAGERVSVQQQPSMGCNIKWKPGNEPDYFG